MFDYYLIKIWNCKFCTPSTTTFIQSIILSVGWSSQWSSGTQAELWIRLTSLSALLCSICVGVPLIASRLNKTFRNSGAPVGIDLRMSICLVLIGSSKFGNWMTNIFIKLCKNITYEESISPTNLNYQSNTCNINVCLNVNEKRGMIMFYKQRNPKFCIYKEIWKGVCWTPYLGCDDLFELDSSFKLSLHLLQFQLNESCFFHFSLQISTLDESKSLEELKLYPQETLILEERWSLLFSDYNVPEVTTTKYI